MILQESMNWVLVENISLTQLEEGKIIETYAGQKTICLLLKGNTVLAFAATCPHQGAKMCEGWMDAKGQIVCALHHYKFAPESGRNTSGEGYKLRTYSVDIRGTEIYLAINS
ncbi:MAG: Rieske (2Fe-2S) protein [Bacteroidetes bacterium]|nr:Rieske (2Fe-2S) protein [Bacteroidota bacterium]